MQKRLCYLQRVLKSNKVNDNGNDLQGDHSDNNKIKKKNAMQETVAAIAYMPYDSIYKPAWDQVLTVANLAATLASLTQHGVGRIVVVSQEKNDNLINNHTSSCQAMAQAAFRLVTLRHQVSVFEDWNALFLD